VLHDDAEDRRLGEQGALEELLERQVGSLADRVSPRKGVGTYGGERPRRRRRREQQQGHERDGDAAGARR
jgi:hypothetical protein